MRPTTTAGRLRAGLILVIVSPSLLAAAAVPAPTTGPAHPSAEARQIIAQRIESQKTRRGLGIASTAVGGIVFASGVAVGVKNAVDDIENTDRCNNGGECRDRKAYSGTAIALNAAGSALIGLGVYLIVDSNAQIRRAQRGLDVSLAPAGDGGTQLAMAYRF